MSRQRFKQNKTMGTQTRNKATMKLGDHRQTQEQGIVEIRLRINRRESTITLQNQTMKQTGLKKQTNQKVIQNR